MMHIMHVVPYISHKMADYFKHLDDTAAHIYSVLSPQSYVFEFTCLYTKVLNTQLCLILIRLYKNTIIRIGLDIGYI